jgi:hypothetical protein
MTISHSAGNYDEILKIPRRPIENAGEARGFRWAHPPSSVDLKLRGRASSHSIVIPVEVFMKTAFAVIATAVLSLAAAPAFAGKSCDELKAEIAAKMDANGVKGYSLEAVPNDQVKDGKVVGSCEGGTKKIVYKKG